MNSYFFPYMSKGTKNEFIFFPYMRKGTKDEFIFFSLYEEGWTLHFSIEEGNTRRRGLKMHQIASRNHRFSLSILKGNTRKSGLKMHQQGAKIKNNFGRGGTHPPSQKNIQK